MTHATTILAVRKGGEVVLMGDGQATQDAFVVKANVTKVRRLGSSAIGGFAGRAADGLTLFERLEQKMEEHPGQLRRAAVELAKDWRRDRVLRHLDVSGTKGGGHRQGDGERGKGAVNAQGALRALLLARRTPPTTP